MWLFLEIEFLGLVVWLGLKFLIVSGGSGEYRYVDVLGFCLGLGKGWRIFLLGIVGVWFW